MPISAHTLNTICRTLFHSLWIGILIAVLAGIVVSLTKKTSPRLRYNLFCALLLLFVLGTVLTFFWEWGATYAPSLSATTSPFPKHPGQLTNSVPLTNWTDFADRWSTAIVSAWLLFAAFKTIKLMGELIHLRKVRNTGKSETSSYWQEKTTELASRLHIRKNIRLMESALIRIPVTIGYFRPLILIPTGALLQLSSEQVESILYHELAHILRRDYLINILQSVVEAVFFFNPAIWWLSALIREEREACCDELVLAQVPQKSTYLETLMIFQQEAIGSGKLTMGLSLHRPQLMNRLRRMVNRENQQLNVMEKIVLLAGLVLLLVFTFVPKANLAAGKGADFVSRQVITVLKQLSHAVPAQKPFANQAQQSSGPPKNPIVTPKLSDDTIKPAPVRPKTQNAETKFHPSETGFAAAKERASGIITSLISAKVVNSRADIEWFGLSADELIVNGVKQPETLHQLLKERFGITADNGIYYGPVKMNGKGDFLNKSDF